MALFPPALLADSRRTLFTSTYSASEHVYCYTREQTYEINQTGITPKMVGHNRSKMRSGCRTGTTKGCTGAHHRDTACPPPSPVS